MSVTAALMIVAFAGLAVAMAAQLRAFGRDRAEFRQTQKKSAAAFVALLLLLGAIQFVHASRLIPRLLAPEVDGSWAVVVLDGRPVAGEYVIAVRDGRVAAGRDACNDWGFADERIITTLVACEEEDPVRRAYWALATAPRAALELRNDGTLRIAARGHVALLRRCRTASGSPAGGRAGDSAPC